MRGHSKAMEHISDVIGEDYKQWDSRKAILIETPMGSGKTYFALNVLLPFVCQQGKSMIYFTNRVALTEQVKNAISIKNYQDSVGICSYQQFVGLDLSSRSTDKQKTNTNDELAQRVRKADYYVLDEAHYFLTDSSFNMKIKECTDRMRRLREDRPESVWIYMTATMSYLILHLSPVVNDIPYLQFVGRDKDSGLPPPHFKPYGSIRALLEYKEDYTNELVDQWGRTVIAGTNNSNQKDYFFRKAQLFNDREESLRKRETTNYRYYGIPFDFSYITPVYYSESTEILKAILSTPQDEKWLIFTDSKEEGNYLKEKLIDIAFDKDIPLTLTSGLAETTFITSSSRKMKGLRESQTLEDIIKQERFKQRVVITTRVLDNGVNIKDPQLKHIVIDAYEKTEFLQMLGRKRRVNEEDRILLYIRDIPEGTLRTKVKNQILSILQFWRELLVCQATPARNKIFACDSFLTRYSAGGQYRRPYQPYVEPKSSYEPKEDLYRGRFKLIDQYEPASYAKEKMTYDYYHLMAMFEQAQNERQNKIENSIGKNLDPQSYIKADLELWRNQFMWLREQLSWIGFTSQEYDPGKSQYWITEQMGWARSSREELYEFLWTNEGKILTEEEEDCIKELFRTWIQNIRPIHRYANSKGSKSIINRCFQEFNIPYSIKSRNKSIKGVQRNWWIIEKLNDPQE